MKWYKNVNWLAAIVWLVLFPIYCAVVFYAGWQIGKWVFNDDCEKSAGIHYQGECLTQREALVLARKINGTEHWAKWGGH